MANHFRIAAVAHYNNTPFSTYLICETSFDSMCVRQTIYIKCIFVSASIRACFNILRAHTGHKQFTLIRMGLFVANHFRIAAVAHYTLVRTKFASSFLQSNLHIRAKLIYSTVRIVSASMRYIQASN